MTTLAPGTSTEPIPLSLPERFEKRDFIASLYVFFLTFMVYVLTLAPNVTLEDSGELITGAVTFGVPHPPGYPLWTLSGFIFSHLIPFGNLAWRVNLQSAFYGAAANGILALLISHSSRWLLQRWVPLQKQPALRPYCFYAAIAAGLTLGFSDVMWSQSVVAEVYSLNAFFLSMVLITFYFWLLRPEKTDRLLGCVFVFAFGLTNHHTLIQIIPAFLFASFLLSIFKRQSWEAFWSLFIAVNLFSLSILTFLSWLSKEELPGGYHPSPIGAFIEMLMTSTPHIDHNLHTQSLHTISEMMGWLIMSFTLVIAVLYLKSFSPKKFLLGVGVALTLFIYGHYLWVPAIAPDVTATEAEYQLRDSFNINHFWTWGSFVHSGWSQIKFNMVPMMILSCAAMGFLYSSLLNWRMIQGLFFAGWLGLVPYSYELLASSTTPPMNWGYVSGTGGFYYAVTRAQYPMSLPGMIKSTIGKKLGVTTAADNSDPGIDQPRYFSRLFHTFLYFGEDVVDYFCIPLILFPILFLIYWYRADSPQWVWILFLGFAFFTLGFLLHILDPPQSFDVLTGQNYKVFFLQAHCILTIFLGYGILAGLVFLNEILDPQLLKYGPAFIGGPFIFLSLITLLHNFEDCNQAEHWFGWNYGYDMINPLPRNAIFFGGNDPGRFVPTYMVFGESQQSDYWKRDPKFDRRDVFVITQNALVDAHYLRYIEDQYDAQYRPATWTPFEKWLGRDHNYPEETIHIPSSEELAKVWDDYYHSERGMRNGGRLLSQTELFYVNGIIAKMIFDRNPDHDFYVEQSNVIEWMQPYMIPDGLIFKINHTPLDKIDPKIWEKDHEYWLNYAGRLLGNPNLPGDQDACHWYSTLVYNRALLAQYRNLPEEVEFYDKLAILLCPYYFEPIFNLVALYHHLNRYDDAIAVLKEALVNDPRNQNYNVELEYYAKLKAQYATEKHLEGELKKDPNDVASLLELAKSLEFQDKMEGTLECLSKAATIGTNWNPENEGNIIHYYSPQVLPRTGETAKQSRPEASLVFLRAREKFEPTVPNIPLFIAKEELLLHDIPGALKDLRNCFYLGGEVAQQTCLNDPFLSALLRDNDFQRLIHTDPRLLGPQPSDTTNSIDGSQAPTQTNSLSSKEPSNGPPTPGPATSKSKSNKKTHK